MPKEERGALVLPVRDRRLLGVLLFLCLPYAVFTYAYYPPASVHRGLVFNVFLAALPLLPALFVARRGLLGKRGWPAGAACLVWLAFYPNAPYLFTDLIHVQTYDFYAGATTDPSGHIWISLFQILFSVAVGSVLGFYSLYRLHQHIQSKKGRAAGWVFVAAVSFLSGVGIFIGRFLRFNTWDILRRPLSLLQTLGGRLSFQSLLFCFLFTALAFGGYGLFYLCFHVPVSGKE